MPALIVCMIPVFSTRSRSPTWQEHCCIKLFGTRRYIGHVEDYNKAYEGAKAAIINKFYGPPTKGVYSPSVQYTLYQMALEMFAK